MEPRLTEIQVSQLLRYAICPSAYAEERGKPNVDQTSSALGTAYHAYIAGILSRKPNTFDAVAREHQVSVIDLARLVQQTDLSLLIPHERDMIEVEVHLDFPLFRIIGHADYVRRTKNLVIVYDWKTTSDPDSDVTTENDPRMNAYGLAIMQMEKLPRIMLAKYYPRLGMKGYDCFLMEERHKADRMNWIESIVLRAESMLPLTPAQRDYRLHPYFAGCRGCRGADTCAALRHTVARAVALIGGKEAVDFNDPQQVLRVWEARQWANAAARQSSAIGAAIQRHIEQHGPIPVDSEHMLQLNAAGVPAVMRRRLDAEPPRKEITS
jgi:hypothetical protein